MVEILVVDDKPEVRKSFSRLLAAEGYTVRTAANGDKALEAILIRKPDLVVLDIDMPKRNGFSTCEEIRKFDRLLPVIFITGYDSEVNELRARGIGADDFFPKTADDAIVLATIRRALARSSAAGSACGQVPSAPRIVMGAVAVDTRTFDVISGGRVVDRLTKTEMDILRALVDGGGRSFSVDELISRLRGEGFACEDAMLYMHMSNLRRKLGPASDCIISVRGEGYHFKL